MKPTVGLVSRRGIIPISKTQDTAGPMTRSVRDAAIVLSYISAKDPEDGVTLKRSPGLSTDYATVLRAGGLEGKRIGVEKSFFKSA